MSHFTHIKTRFQNLFYLEKALNRIGINYKREDFKSKTANLIIPQSNGYNITLDWNGQEYELIADMSFWEQAYPFQTFIDRLSKQYAGEVIIGESRKVGFLPAKFRQNEDGSNLLVLQRWNNEKAA